MWRLVVGFEMLDIGNDYFMVRFELEEDRIKMIKEGLWMVFDHYLIVQT